MGHVRKNRENSGVNGLSRKEHQMFHDRKDSSKRSEFSDFICTFAMSFGDFAILVCAALR